MKMNQKNNIRWKWAFFALLAGLFIMCAIVIVVFYYFTAPVEQTPELDNQQGQNTIEDDLSRDEDAAILHVNMDKHSLNHMLRQRMNDIDSEVEFAIIIEDDIRLESRINLFNRDVPVAMSFDVEVLDNGNLLLHYDSMQISMVELPAKWVLQTLQRTLPLPPWMQIDAQQSQIVLVSQHLTPDEDYSIRFVTFNLIEDEIEIEVLMDVNAAQ